MSQWNFQKPEIDGDAGSEVFALVVYTKAETVGVRPMEKGEVVDAWHEHAFAWRPIDYPTFTIGDLHVVAELWNKRPKADDSN